MFRLFRPHICRRISYSFRHYAATPNTNQPIVNAIQNLEKDHERLLRVVEKRIRDRKLMYSQASSFQTSLPLANLML